MRLAICDDQEIFMKEMNHLLLDYQKDRGSSFDILIFSSPDRLYTYMEEHSVDLVFMDLNFGSSELDGITWSTKIHRQYPKTLLVILTAHDSRYKEGFLVRAFRFMTKPVLRQELYENLDACLEELYLHQDLTLTRLGVPHKIALCDILYLTALNGGSEIRTVDDIFYSDQSLLFWELELPSGSFFRCHKTYLINLQHVQHPENHLLLMDNGKKLPVSRRKWAALKLAFMKFDVSGYGLR